MHLILFSAILLLHCNFNHGRQLIQGNLIWRHGDRSSGHTYPYDPYKYVWKDGPMQLTEKGMSQAYDLGLYLKSKYGLLISERYEEGEILIKSTDTDRTIMTAQCVGAGLYAPENSSIWKDINTPWRPSPIHVESSKHDWLFSLLTNPEKGCPAFVQLKKKIYDESEFYKFIIKEYNPFFENMTALTGVFEPWDFRSIIGLYDNLFCLLSHGFKLPLWANDHVMKTLIYLAAQSQGLDHTDHEMKYTKILSKMRNGVILQNMLENMKSRINSESNYSIVGYSAHDSSLTPLLVSMGAFNWIIPPYASCVMLDLYLEDDSSFSVEFWYRNDSTMDPHRLSFYECGTRCSFEKFEKVASAVIPGRNNDKLCGIDDCEFDTPCRNYITAGVSIFVLFFAIVVALQYCCNRRTRSKYLLLPRYISKKY